MASKKLKKTFAVKTQTVVLNEKQEDAKTGLSHTETVALGEKLSWADAVTLRKENAGSYIHPENRVYKTAKKSKKEVKENG